MRNLPLTDQVMFLPEATGVSWSKLDPKLQKELGPAVVKAILHGIFVTGSFDPDRHTRNIKVDPIKKKIYMLDFGQALSFSKNPAWSHDDVSRFARFVSDLSTGNANSLLAHSLEMVDPSRRNAQKEDGIETAVRGAFARTRDKPFSDRLIAVGNTLAEHGRPIESRFMNGGAKALLTMGGENYVTAPEFREHVASYVQKALVAKAPATAVDVIKRLGGNCEDLMQKIFRR